MNNSKIYSELEKLVITLKEIGEIEISNEISDNLYYSSTATEILMKCRFTLKKFLKNNQLPLDLKDNIRNILMDIDYQLK